MNGLITVPISIGELADKITILQIKSERIGDPAQLRHVEVELLLLQEAWRGLGDIDDATGRLIDELKKTNERLWVIEDDIRDCERRLEFGSEFVALAREVYRTNDRRAEIKREINRLAGSAIVEEKSYRASSRTGGEPSPAGPAAVG